ncbi:hypothetical protein GCM10010193_31270 [Kitasatospora atroaurantiaca]
MGVLDEFAQRDQGGGVQVGGEHTDQTTEIDLGRPQILLGYPAGLETFRHEASVCQYDNRATSDFRSN